MIGYGIDVSHHQVPATLPWERFRGHVDAVIVRAAYGTKLDTTAVEHVRRAREIGAKVGLYTFFRDILPVADQFDVLRRVAESVKLGPGDIVPTIDIERDPIPKPGRDACPAWSAPAEELVGKTIELFDNAMIYITHREWKQLGSPAWVLHRPLFVAHYTAAAKPASPGGMAPTMWQHRVGPFIPNGPGGYDKEAPVLDQFRILQPLPLIGARITDEDRERVMGLVALTLDQSIRDEDADTEPAGPPLEIA